MVANVPVDADLRRRVGLAWREIRRGSSAFRVRELFYTVEGNLLDLALADALGVVAQRGPIRMGDLADALRITPASTTRAVSCLVDKGFVRRVPNERDNRSIMVEVTEEGRAQQRLISGRIQWGLAHILNEFSDDEQRQLADYLERFVSAIDRLVVSDRPEPQG